MDEPQADDEDDDRTFNTTLRRRLVGLAVIVGALLLLSLLLTFRGEHRNDARIVAEIPLKDTAGAAREMPPTASSAPAGDAAASLKPAPQAAPMELRAGEDDAEPEAPAELALEAAPKVLPSTPAAAGAKTPAAAPPAKTPPAPSAAIPASAAAKPPAAPAASGFFIQVGSFSSEATADTVASLLRAGGFRSALTPVATAKGTLYRVRIGPYGSAAEADAELPKVRHQGYPAAQRVSEP